jgi:medium-chain acyl-[acyl-carrier-protein] hydrolase
LPKEIAICPVQLPGRENRLQEKPFSDLPSLLEALLPALLPYLDMPYAFFGHSMGALVGFELARVLASRGSPIQPTHLFLSGRSAPQWPDSDPPSSQLPEPEFIEKLRTLNGTPEAVLENQELLCLLLPLLRADFALCETYCYLPTVPLYCPLTVFGGLSDKDVPRESLNAWREVVSGPFKLRLFPGDHFFLLKEQASLLHVLVLDLLKHIGPAMS